MSTVQTERSGPLTSRFTAEELHARLLPRASWRPYPTADDRAGWAALPTDLRATTVAAAETRLGVAWPDLPAALFLEYARDGNRSRYEARHHERRVALAELALGECVEGQGRFLDEIINGIWAICEESFWGVPAHSYTPRFATGGFPAGRYPTAGLPDTAYPVIDLFAAETGALLAWVRYLLGSRLGAALPIVVDRLDREVRARILEPYLAIDGWHWLGNNPARKVNNWNPWIHSNILAMTLLIEDDPAVRERTVARIVAGLDAFLAVYHEDGGCDEGASYWNRAGGSLFDCLDLLASASAGGLVAFDLPLVREIARYIYRAHIGGEWFVNFADGPARLAPEQGVLYPFGRAIGDERLMALGSATLGDAPDRKRRPSIGRSLRELFLAEELAVAAEPPLIREAWLPGVEVLVAREREGATDGLFLAAKGGHNAESHNHNDIGNFIVALDGKPILIDVGVGVYTRQTFGPERYSIWTMGSGHHNLPLIDGQEQAVGGEFGARDVAAIVEDDAAELSLDIAPAYPPEAGVRRWQRTLRLDRGPDARVTLREEYELAARPGTLALHLMVSGTVDADSPGTLRCAGASRPLLVRYDPAVFIPRVEEIAIDDARLQSAWGERIFRVVLEVREPQSRGEWTLTMAPGER